MGKFLGLELSLSTGPVAGATVGNTKDPLKGEGLSGAGKASPAPTPQSHLPFHLGHHPVSPSPGTLSHTTLCFCPCPDCPGPGGQGPGHLVPSTSRESSDTGVEAGAGFIWDLILERAGPGSPPGSAPHGPW